jgi:hypothetical protein
MTTTNYILHSKIIPNKLIISWFTGTEQYAVSNPYFTLKGVRQLPMDDYMKVIGRAGHKNPMDQYRFRGKERIYVKNEDETFMPLNLCIGNEKLPNEKYSDNSWMARFKFSVYHQDQTLPDLINSNNAVKSLINIINCNLKNLMILTNQLTYVMEIMLIAKIFNIDLSKFSPTLDNKSFITNLLQIVYKFIQVKIGTKQELLTRLGTFPEISAKYINNFHQEGLWKNGGQAWFPISEDEMSGLDPSWQTPLTIVQTFLKLLNFKLGDIMDPKYESFFRKPNIYVIPKVRRGVGKKDESKIYPSIESTINYVNDGIGDTTLPTYLITKKGIALDGDASKVKLATSKDMLKLLDDKFHSGLMFFNIMLNFFNFKFGNSSVSLKATTYYFVKNASPSTNGGMISLVSSSSLLPIIEAVKQQTSKINDGDEDFSAHEDDYDSDLDVGNDKINASKHQKTMDEDDI